MTESLNVMLWGLKVGTLVSSKIGYKSRIFFYFDPQFVKSGLNIAPVRAPLSSVAVKCGMPISGEYEKMFGGLPSFIADSLPDNWGDRVFNEWAKVHNIKQSDLTALDRLAYIGRRGMGALEFMPVADLTSESPFRVEIAKLSDLARMVMDEAKQFHASLSPTLAIESLFKVGTSAGGRRTKAVINVNRKSGECYSGQVATPYPGFTPMIIKFDEHSGIPSTRIEYSYWLMAVSAGLNMMPSNLLECGNETHFLTERFDRRGDEKIHVQTLAAMCPHASSYEDLFETALKIGIPADEMRMLYRQMVMNILAANVDDHTKNFSFMMDRTGIWHIAPAYDFTFTVDPSSPAYINRHSMTVNGSDYSIRRSDLTAVAERFNIKAHISLIESAMSAVGRYREFAVDAGVPEIWIKKIEAEIESRIQGLGQ